MRYRAEAVDIADLVGAPDSAVKALSRMIGAALGTQQVPTSSRALAARQASLPYDQDRMRLFRQLVDGLRQAAPQNRPVPDPRDPRYEHLPFFEAYFSNFIEGTEFEMDEAVAIVYDGRRMPGARGRHPRPRRHLRARLRPDRDDTRQPHRRNSWTCCGPGMP